MVQKNTIIVNDNSNNTNNNDKIKNKCTICKKKLGLVPFTCRCGDNFCAIHRYETEHNCTFDHKTFGRQQLEKDNKKIVADKIEKI